MIVEVRKAEGREVKVLLYHPVWYLKMAFVTTRIHPLSRCQTTGFRSFSISTSIPLLAMRMSLNSGLASPSGLSILWPFLTVYKQNHQFIIRTPGNTHFSYPSIHAACSNPARRPEANLNCSHTSRKAVTNPPSVPSSSTYLSDCMNSPGPCRNSKLQWSVRKSTSHLNFSQLPCVCTALLPIQPKSRFQEPCVSQRQTPQLGGALPPYGKPGGIKWTVKGLIWRWRRSVWKGCLSALSSEGVGFSMWCCRLGLSEMVE